MLYEVRGCEVRRYGVRRCEVRGCGGAETGRMAIWMCRATASSLSMDAFAAVVVLRSSM